MVRIQKCPNCGANLKLDKTTGILKCNNCDSTFSLDKNDMPEEFNFIDSGNKFLKLEEYKKAFECFEQACNISPDNYACWLGLAKSITKNFTFIDKATLKEAKGYVVNANKCVSPDDEKTLEKELDEYYKLVSNFTRTQKNESKKSTIQSILQTITLTILIIVSIIGLMAIYFSDETSFFWQIIDICVLIAVNYLLYFAIFKLTYLFKFKKPYQTIISIFLFILSLALAVGINIFALSTI